MKTTPEQLSNTLLKSNLSVIWIHGDDLFFVQESVQTARDYFKNKGFQERVAYYPNESGFNWQSLFESTLTQSLFQEKKIVELHFTQTKFPHEILLELFKKPIADIVFIVISPRLDSKQQQSKWFSTLEPNMINVAIWPLTQEQFPIWLQQQLKQANLQLDKDAFQLLLQRMDGNALAAKQQIERLKLLCDHKTIAVNDLLDLVFDQSHFELFDLSDALLQRDAARFVHILERLQQKEIAAPLILWSMTRDIRALMAMLENKPLYETSKKRQQLLQQFSKRIKLLLLQRGLQLSFDIDCVIKGVKSGNVWRQFLQLGLMLMQVNTLTDGIYD